MKLFLVALVTSLIFCSQADAQTNLVLSAKEIIKLIPEKIMNGYTQSSEPKSKVMQIGTLRYALSERNFSSGKKNVKILLFDYIEAPIMYNQATKKFSNFSEVRSDSIVMVTIAKEGASGWEFEWSRNNSSQILLGIYDRYYLTIEGAGVSLEDLRIVLELIQIEKFPR